MVGISVAQYDFVELDVEGAQKWHQHPVACITLAAKARARIVQERVAGGAHQYGVALADVSGQHVKLTRRRLTGLPQHHGQQHGQAQKAHRPRQAHRHQHAAHNTQNTGPNWRLRNGDAGKGQACQHLQKSRQHLNRTCCKTPSR